MKLAISATTMRANFAPILLQRPLEENFIKASDLGYDAIELHLRQPNEIDWDKTIELSDKFSLPVTAIGTGAGARVDGLTFTDSNPEIRNKSIERIKEYLELAKLLDCAIILGSMNGNIKSNKKGKEHHLDCIKQCCNLASQENITILIEPLNRYESDWLNTVDDTLEIIEQTEYPNLKYLADTFHMNIEEVDITESIKKAGKELGYVHLVDSNRQVPGHGHVAFTSVLGALKHIGYDGYLSFECLPIPNTETASLDAVNFTRPIM
jgi:sugar phosphate isomerase/epimerase